ncbi:hypothetical protein KQUDLBSD_CDS0148 [Staphylococcus phage PG-2021_40]
MVIMVRISKQVKKHSKQMIKGEKYNCSVLAKQAFRHKGISKSPHLEQRMMEKGISIDMSLIAETLLDNGLLHNILEYNETYVDGIFHQRVLIDIKGIHSYVCHKHGVEKRGKLKVVYDITNGKLVTAYYNSIDDNHLTLNLSNYEGSLVVRPYKYNGHDSRNSGINPNNNYKYKF